MLEKSAKKLHDAFSVDPFDDELIQETIDRAKVIVEMVKNIRTSIDAEEERKLRRETIKSQEDQSLMQQEQKLLEMAQSTMDKLREYEEKLRKEQKEADKELKETIKAYACLNLEGIDLKDVLQYLQQAIQQLTQFQVAWEDVKQFLEGVQMIVDNSLVENVDGFTDWVISNMEKEEVSALIRKAVRKEAMAACVVGSVLYNTATLYEEISLKYVSPISNRALTNMGLTPDEATNRQKELFSNFTRIEHAVNETIKNHNGRLPKAVEESLKKGGFIEEKKSVY